MNGFEVILPFLKPIEDLLLDQPSDALGVWHALILVAAFVLVTLPLAALLRKVLARHGGKTA